MTIDNGIKIFAGIMVLISVAFTVWVSPAFVWLTIFIGLNLIQSAFTGFCPAILMLKKLGLK